MVKIKRQGLAEDGIFTCGNGGSDGELNLRFNAGWYV